MATFDRDWLRREGGRKNAKRRTDFTFADPFEAETPDSFALTNGRSNVRVAPRRVVLSAIALGETARAVLMVTNLSADSVRFKARAPLHASEMGGNRITCSWEPKRIAPGLKARVEITLHTRALGDVACDIELRAEGDVVRVPLSFTVRARTVEDDAAVAAAEAPPLEGSAAAIAALDDELEGYSGRAAAKSADRVAVFASALTRVPQIPNTVWDWSAGPNGTGALVPVMGALLVRPRIDPDAKLADIIAAADAEQAAVDSRLDLWWSQQRKLAGWSEAPSRGRGGTTTTAAAAAVAGAAAEGEGTQEEEEDGVEVEVPESPLRST